MEESIDILYKELQERMEVLENKKNSPITEGRRNECALTIIRVQQLILKKL